MSSNLIIWSAVFCVFIFAFILHLVKKELINVKYSLVWLFLFGLLILCAIIPGLLVNITNFFGFQTASNMILSLLIAILVVINITNTVINSNQDKKIRLLVQELSIMKRDLNNNERK